MRRNYKLEKLQSGEILLTSEKGNSMVPLIKSGQKHKLEPAKWEEVEVGDIAYAKVKGNFYTHLVTAKNDKKGCQISNNQGCVNGWTKAVFGVVVEVVGGTHKRKKRKKKKMKKIIYTSVPNYEVFFDQDGNHITTVHENDANMRNEYHGSLFKHFGIELKYKAISDKLEEKMQEDEEKDVWDYTNEIKKEIIK